MKISLSMSYSKKKAQDIVQNELQSVGLHIAKIWVHKPSQYDEKWEADISDFFIKIIRVSNNTTSGSLKKSWLIEKLTDYFDLSTADCPRVHKDELYKSMLKCDPNSDMCYKNATNHLSPRLIKISKQVAEIILENEYESHKKIAKVIADAVIDARNTFYGL